MSRFSQPNTVAIFGSKNESSKSIKIPDISKELEKYNRWLKAGGNNAESFATTLDAGIVKDYFAQVKDGVASVEDFTKFAGSAADAAGSLASNASSASIGTSLLNGALGGLAGIAANLVIDLIVTGITNLINAQENAIKKADEALTNLERRRESLQNNRSTINEISGDYERLADGDESSIYPPVKRHSSQLVSELPVQPIDGKPHPAGVVAIYSGEIVVRAAGFLGACGHSVPAGGENMSFIGDFLLLQGAEELQRIFHRHAVVLHRVPHEGGAGLFADPLVQRKILIARGALFAAADVFDGFHMGIFICRNHRISQNHGIGAVFSPVVVIDLQKLRGVPHGAKRAGQMTAGGKAADGNMLRVYPPFLMAADCPHGLGKLPQGQKILCLFLGGIGEDKDIIPPGKEGDRHRVCFSLRYDRISAAGTDH